MGLFGSKKKTVRGIGYSKLFPEISLENDLFNNRMIQAVASYKTMDSFVIGQALLEVNKHFQYTAFQKLDGATYQSYERVSIDDEDVEDALRAKDPDFLVEVSRTLVDSDEDVAAYQLTNIYGRPILGDCPDTWTWLVNGNRVVIIEALVKPDVDGNLKCYVDVGTCWDTGPVLTDSLVLDYVTPPIYKIEYTYSGTQDTYPSFLVDETLVYLVDDTLTYLVDPSVPTESNIRIEYLLQNSVESVEEVDSTFLTAMYKTNFVPNDTKYIRAINSRMGIPNYPVNSKDEPEPGSLQESIDSPYTKHLMLTYCVDYREPYIEIIDELLGTDGYRVEFAPGRYMRYASSTNDRYTDPLTGYYQIFDDYPLYFYDRDDDDDLKIPNDNKVQYMIPMEWILLNRTLVEKYDDLQECLTLFAYTQQTVKIKWYQTSFFQILIAIFAIAVFIYTGNPSMLIGIASGYVIQLLDLSPTMTALLGVIIAVVSVGSNLSSALSAQNAFATMSSLINNISKLYFTIQIENINDTSREIEEGMEATEEAMEELTRQGIYIPLDSISNFYDSMYTMQYDMYNDIYDYDKMYYNQNNMLTKTITKDV